MREYHLTPSAYRAMLELMAEYWNPVPPTGLADPYMWIRPEDVAQEAGRVARKIRLAS